MNTDISAVHTHKANVNVPVIVSLPHGGTYMPARFSGELIVPPGSLLSDWATLELYDFLNSLGISTVETRWSRFVADVNRDPDMPLFAPFWEGIVASTDEPGKSIYRKDLDAKEVELRLDLAYRPYHAAVNELVKARLESHSRVLLIDLHSFGMPLAADVIIGNSNGETARDVTTRIVEAALNGSNFSSLRNERFRGGWIVRQYEGNERVDAIQLELNQRLYLRPEEVEADIRPRRPDGQRFDDTKQRLVTVMTEIIRMFPAAW